MHKTYNKRFNREVYEIFAGDFFATAKQEVVLATLLGSCVSICLKDQDTGVVGINHFMLPARVRHQEMVCSQDARYGINAMELLINKMLQLGARKNQLQAKVFGGGEVMDLNLSNVAASNVEFALNFLQLEEIPVMACDVGGKYGRKIYFLPDTFTVYLKRLEPGKSIEQTIAREKTLQRQLQHHRNKGGELTIFDGERGIGRNGYKGIGY